jgi:amino acid permease
MSTAFTSKLHFVTGTATFFFTYAFHVGTFPVYQSLKNNTERRIHKVYSRGIMLNSVIYLFVGICGFLSQPIGAKDLIIYRKSEGILSGDVAMIIGRLAIAISLLLSTPSNYNSFRLSFLELCGWDSTNISNKQYVFY